MITKGTSASRAAALLVAASPVLLAFIAFCIWAVFDWRAQGRVISNEDRRQRQLEATASQTQFYASLGEVWREYAGAADSGLLQSRRSGAAETEMELRAMALYAEFGGRGLSAETLPREDLENLERLRIETSGELPQSNFPDFLAAFETIPPYMFIDYLDVRQAKQDDDETILSVRIRASGYRLLEAPQ